MSADNYHYVEKQPDGDYGVWLDLSASLDYDGLGLGPPDKEWNTLEDAVRWAQEQGWTEYGVTIAGLGQDQATAPTTDE